MKLASSRIIVNVFLILTCSLSKSTINAQEQAQPFSRETQVRKNIEGIMRDTIKKGEFFVNGTLAAWRRVPPSEEAIEDIQEYGDDAIPILSEHLDSQDGREKELAMRFLGLLGGSRIVEPLRKVVQYEDSPTLREIALRWLTRAPWDEVVSIIREAEETDPDPGVRKVARNLLAEQGRK